jgi:hypothetical protein
VGDTAAYRTGLRGEGRRYLEELAATEQTLVVEHPVGFSPGHAEDGAIQSRLGLDIPPRTLEGTARRASHILDAQVFQHDKAVVLGQIGGLVVQPVFPSASLPERSKAICL